MVIVWDRPRITYFGKGDNLVTLKPGSNLVDDKVGKVLMEDKNFKEAVKCGAAKVLGVKASKEVIGEDGTAKSPLSAYDLKGCKAYIAECFDPVTLKSIVDLETRAKVKEMAEDRLAELLKAQKQDGKPAGEGQGEGDQGQGQGEGGAAE